jgi:type I restriction enzyme S subunit
MADRATIRLGDACTKIGSGATPRGGRDSYKGGATALIRSQNIYNDGFHHDGLVHIDDAQAAELNGVEVRPCDVLLNITGDSVARCTQVDPVILPARVNQHVLIIRPRPDVLDPGFLRYALVAPAMQASLLVMASAGATRNALTKNMIEDLAVEAPPIEQQRAIAHILGTLDDKIDLNRRTNDTLEAMARALFKSWFVDFDPVHAKAAGRQPSGMDAATAALFPSEFVESELGRIPKGWRVSDVYALADVDYGAPYASKRFNSGGLGRPVVRIRDLKDQAPDVFTDEVHARDVVVRAGDVLVGMDGEFRAQVWGGPEAVLNQRCCRFRALERMDATFVRLAIEPQLRFVEDTEVATTVIHLGKYDIDRFRVIHPSRSVLNAYGVIVKPVIDRWIVDCHESRSLASLRDTLLPRLLSGELAIPDAERFVEAAT